MLGFLEPVVARVPLAAAQERLRELLEAKWRGPRPRGRRLSLHTSVARPAAA